MSHKDTFYNICKEFLDSWGKDQFHIIDIDLTDEIFMLSAGGGIKADRYAVTLINLRTSSTEKLTFHTRYNQGPTAHSHTIHSQLMMYVRAHA